MRFFPLLLALSTTVTAAPLIQSTTSVAEGHYCTTYTCQLVHRDVILPETMGVLIYEYALQGGVLTVSRLQNKAILGGSLEVPAQQWNTALVRDFFRTFAGLTPEPSALRTCVRRAMSTSDPLGIPLTSATIDGVQFTAHCHGAQGHRVVFSVMDSRDLFR